MLKDTIKTIPDLFNYRLKGNTQQVLFEKKDNQWTGINGIEFLERGNLLSHALLKIGLSKGDTVGILADNSPSWHILDYALSQIGIISIPIFTNIKEAAIPILNHAKCKFVFTSSIEVNETLKSNANKLEYLKTVYAMEKGIEGLKSFNLLIEEHQADFDEKALNAEAKKVNENDLLSIIYTSGTTGEPKGVQLTHLNIISNVKYILPRVPVLKDAKTLCLLPLCHIFERTLTYCFIALEYCSIYYLDVIDKIATALKEVKPNIFAGVPRIFKGFYDKIEVTTSKQKGIKKYIAEKAFNLAKEYELEKLPLVHKMKIKLADMLVYKKWREALGGNISIVVSGGAALPEYISKLFWGASIPVIEGYGMTEASPVICVGNINLNKVRLGTTGPALENVTVKLAADGEILVKGPNVTKGYYNNPKANEELFDSQGYLKTGDLGKWEGEYLKITGRKKELFKLSSGKYVSPEHIENIFLQSKYIPQIMIIGEGQPHLTAIIYCDEKETTRETIKKEIRRIGAVLPLHEQVKKTVFLKAPFSIENKMLTPTLKLKRKFILTHLNDILID